MVHVAGKRPTRQRGKEKIARPSYAAFLTLSCLIGSARDSCSATTQQPPPTASVLNAIRPKNSISSSTRARTLKTGSVSSGFSHLIFGFADFSTFFSMKTSKLRTSNWLSSLLHARASARFGVCSKRPIANDLQGSRQSIRNPVRYSFLRQTRPNRTAKTPPHCGIQARFKLP